MKKLTAYEVGYYQELKKENPDVQVYWYRRMVGDKDFVIVMALKVLGDNLEVAYAQSAGASITSFKPVRAEFECFNAVIDTDTQAFKFDATLGLSPGDAVMKQIDLENSTWLAK